MKIKLLKGIILLTLILGFTLFLQSCYNRIDRTYIEGYFYSNPHKYVYLSRFHGDSLTVIDSIETSSKGHFKTTFQSENPYFVTVGFTKNQSLIVLLVQPGEEMVVKAQNQDLSDYKVSGSNGSSLIQGLTYQLNRTKTKIDSLQHAFDLNVNSTKKDSVVHLLDSTFRILVEKHRNYSIGFINNNSFSLASILALSQEYDSLHKVFDYSKDRKYYRMIDSSLLSVYSSNSMVKSFHAKIHKLDSLFELKLKRQQMFKEGETLPNAGYPLVTGENLFVSGIWFKSILIDFSAEWCNECEDRNKELREIYKEFGPKGLVILQVSLGVNPDSLRKQIVRDSLFWYHAAIPDYLNSKLLDTLKVTSVPANYITDRWGKIKSVNLEGDRLKSKLSELLR